MAEWYGKKESMDRELVKMRVEAGYEFARYTDEELQDSITRLEPGSKLRTSLEAELTRRSNLLKMARAGGGCHGI